MPAVPPVLAEHQWLIPEDQARPSTVILAVIALGGMVVGLLAGLGVLKRVLAAVGAFVRWGIRTGFRAWEWGLSWAPWPVYAGLVIALLAVGILLAGVAPAAAILFSLVPLFLGVVACLAFMFIDVERYEVARGYKALHDPVKGQKLAVELAKHGQRVGLPLLASSAVGVIGGYALFNLAVYNVAGEAWFSVPSPDVNYLDFLASAVVHLLSVVDVLHVVDSQRIVHVDVPRPDGGLAKAASAGFKAFFTTVLLQQIFASVRRNKLLAETVADFWSPHPPIHDRARAALPQYGASVLPPLLAALGRVDTLTQEQRDDLPFILATVGPSAIPHLSARLTDRNEHVRAVAAAALGLLRAGSAVPQLARLTADASDLVRLSVAEALGEMGRGGWPPPAVRRGREWWQIRPFWRVRASTPVSDPTAELVAALRAGLADTASAVRAAAAESAGRFGPREVGELVPVLLERTADEDETVRVRAVYALAAAGGERAGTVHALVKLLAEPNPAVRTAAATALGSLKAKADEAVSALAGLFDDRDERVRAAAAEAIEKIGSLPAAATTILADALVSADTVRRERAVEAIGKLGGVAADLVPQLARAADDTNDRVRAKAVSALGQVGGSAASVAVPKLVRALKAQDEWVSALAAEALGELGAVGGDAALQGLVRSLSHPNAEVRASAAEAIGKLGPMALPAAARLEQAAADADSTVREQAVRALGRVGRPRPTTMRLVHAALTDPDPRLREAGVAAFGEWGYADADARARLLELLDDANDGVKLGVVSVLPRLVGDGEQVVAALTHRLTADDSDRVKVEVARSLGQLGEAAASAGPALVRLVKTGGADIRTEALRAVLHVRPPELADALTAGLHDVEPEVRVLASAGWRMATAIPEEAVAALVEALHDPEVQVRANAAFAVGLMDPIPAEAVPLLADCMGGGDVGLRMNAALALQAAPGRAAAVALRPLLQDDNPRLRLIAARRELIEDPTDATAAEVIAGAIADPTLAVQRAAADLLANLPPDAVPTVLDAVRTLRTTHPDAPSLAEVEDRLALMTTPEPETSAPVAAGSLA